MRSALLIAAASLVAALAVQPVQAAEAYVSQAGGGATGMAAAQLASVRSQMLVTPVALSIVQKAADMMAGMAPAAVPGMNQSQILQIGRDNVATVTQMGGGNASLVIQQGRGNTAVVTQVGRAR